MINNLVEAQQQAIDETYFYPECSYNFNLPKLGVSLKLPAYTGFKAENSDDIAGFMNIEAKGIYYFFDPLILEDKSVDIRFALSETCNNILFMGITCLNEGVDTNSICKAYSESNEYISALPELKSALGKFIGFRLEQNGQLKGIYLGFYNKFFYFFQFDSENENACREIIKSLKTERFKNKLFASYNEYISEGLEGDDANYEAPELKEYEGVIQYATIFSIPMLGINVSIPQTYTYTVKANRLINSIDNEHEKQLMLSKKDLKNHSMVPLQFSYKGLFVMYMLCENINPKERIEADIKIQNKLKKFQLQINGIMFEAAALGHNESPNINAYAQLNGFGLSLSFLNVEKDKLAEVEYLLNGITFSNKQKDGIDSTGKVKSISQQVNIKDKTLKSLSEINFVKSTNNEEGLINYNFTDLGISFLLPQGNESISPQENLRTLSTLQREITGNLDDNQFLSVNISNDDYSKNMSVSISKSNNAVLVEFMDVMIKSFSSYKHIKVKQKGIGLINGREWGFLLTKQSGAYSLMFFMLHNELCIMVSGSSPSNTTQKYVDLLFDCRFG